MGVLMLAAAQGMRVKVTCRGEDSQQCLDEVAALIRNKFGEEQ
jgi:phosphocarrier protein